MATRPPSHFGSRDKRIGAGFEPRLPTTTRPGSAAAFRKTYTTQARVSMAEIIRKYENLIKSLEAATPTILHEMMMPVYNKSMIYVPKKTGALMASGNLQVGTDERGRPQALLTYGDESTPYAAVVHEMVQNNHESPTRAKYLQHAMEEEFDNFITTAAVNYAMVIGL